MKAYVLNNYGDAKNAVISEWPMPIVKSKEVLVKVAAVGLNPVDYKIRDGKLKIIQNPPRPFVLGNEFSGTIIDCGLGAKKFKIGDKIIARVEKDKMAAFAEFVAIDESIAALAPSSIPLEEAAGLPLAGLTALQALEEELNIKPNDELLITAGAGGVGTLAIQIAKAMGAIVTTTASIRGKDLVQNLGADHVIDYNSTDIGKTQKRFDAVFDLVGGETLESLFTIAKPSTKIVSVAGMPEPLTAKQDLNRGILLQIIFWLASIKLRKLAKQNNVTYRYLFMRPDGAGLSKLSQMIDQGQLKLIIDKSFDFENIAEAIAYLESGRAKGKVIVKM